MNLSTDLVGDEPEKVEGSPGAVQLMQDEELIEIMKVVEKLLKQNWPQNRDGNDDFLR